MTCRHYRESVRWLTSSPSLKHSGNIPLPAVISSTCASSSAAFSTTPTRPMSKNQRFQMIANTLGSGVVLGFFNWFFADWVDHRIDAKISPIALATSKDVEQIRIDVAKVSTQLDMLSKFVQPMIAARLRAASSLAPDQFRKELPQVKAAT